MSAAIALLGDPPVIMLDEPTSGMDIQTRRDFINILSRIIENENKTIIFSSHRYNAKNNRIFFQLYALLLLLFL